MKKFFTKKHQAYSLIELSIVIIILAVLFAGVLSFSTYNASKEKINITKARMDKIYLAMKSYLIANSKLPCPAPINTLMVNDADYGSASTNDGDCAAADGVYQSTTATDLVYGMVPAKTLGLPDEMTQDAFGSKFSYIIDKRFTDAATFGTTAATGIITINEASNTEVRSVTNDGHDAVFAIISHGLNKNGAFASNATTQNSRSSDSYELENDVDNFDFNNVLYISYGASDVFDDLVFYKTRNNLIMDTNTFSLIPCMAYNDGTYDWPQTSYGQYAVSTTLCASNSVVVNPTKKCGAFGIWEDSIANPCMPLANINPICTGGNISRIGNYILHTFNEDGTLICPSQITNAYIFVVGGGGGGGGYTSNSDKNGGGGGGGGQVVQLPNQTINETLNITIGDGGAGGGGDVSGSAGENSTVSSATMSNIIAYGGNGGAYSSASCITTNALGPGGGSGNTMMCGSYQGGNSSSYLCGGGGGSSLGPGVSCSSGSGGNGAVGILHPINGLTYGSGGGGGGSGGGGFGGDINAGFGAHGEGSGPADASSGKPNSGGGGGGGSKGFGYSPAWYHIGKAGGSGIVIIHYQIP